MQQGQKTFAEQHFKHRPPSGGLLLSIYSRQNAVFLHLEK